MNEKRITKISKFMSLVLRHAPEKIGLQLDEAGWAKVDDLLRKMSKRHGEISFEMLQEVVAQNNKKRFAFNEDQSKIRASQGHSIQIDHGYKPISPPNVLYHGTASKNEESILKSGLSKRQRHHVHLSENLDTAISVGKRHGKPIVFEVDCKEMNAKGFVFYKSENDVWLTENVPSVFLAKMQK